MVCKKEMETGEKKEKKKEEKKEKGRIEKVRRKMWSKRVIEK
jgi:hypothetical protein